MHQESFTRIFRALFTIAKKLKTNEMSSVQRLDKLWHIHIMEHHTAVATEPSITHQHDVEEVIEECIQCLRFHLYSSKIGKTTALLVIVM